jgi:hypothetical protein
MGSLSYIAVIACILMVLVGERCGKDMHAGDTAKGSVDCESVVNHLQWSVPCDDVQKYITSVLSAVHQIRKKDLKKIAPAMEPTKAKTQIAACLLQRHPSLDSISVTESSRGIRIYNNEKKEWINVVMDEN